jgi:hypothetical protein
MKHVKILKHCSPYAKDDVVALEDKQAEKLIENGFAEEHVIEDKKKATNTKKDE